MKRRMKYETEENTHSAVGNLFQVGRHLLRVVRYRVFCSQAFGAWQRLSCA